MNSVLQQTLRGLCFDTGWCYAIFWKLKQQPRKVLTWEDAFYGPKMDDIKTDSSVTTIPTFGQRISGGLVEMEDPIGLSVAKMSYHVYSVGEGIIGRVAFTNKHQWVFSSNEKGMVADGVPKRKAKARALPENYPSGWEQQFAAGVKTIAVIAVSQGVVQLGSTCVIVEDLKLVGHVKALFGTLQNVPGAFLSDFVSEVQKGGTHTIYPLAVTAAHLPPCRDPVLMNVQSTALARISCLPVNMGLATPGSAELITNWGCSGVGRLPMMLASKQMHPWPLPPVSGFQENISHFQRTALDKPCLESLSQSSFPFFKPLIGASTLSTGVAKVNPPPSTGIISHFSLSSKVSPIALPISKMPSSQADYSSSSASAPMLELPEYLRKCSRNGPVSRMKSSKPADGNEIANKFNDIASSIGSWKAGIRTMKEDSFSVVVTSGLADTQRVHCESLVESQQLVGARSAAEQPGSKFIETNRSVGVGRRSAKAQQAESTQCVLERVKHSVKLKQLGFGGSTESQPLNAPLLDAGQVEQGSHETDNGHFLVGNGTAGEIRHPVAESSLLAASTPSLQSFQYCHNSTCSFLQSGQFGGANFSSEKIQSVSERSSVESFQAQENVSLIPMFSYGQALHVERSTSSTIQEESCISEFFGTSAETSALQCERSIQTSATENSPTSALLELSKEFDNSGEDIKDLSCNNLDFHQCISSSLLCDDYFEDLQSSERLFQNPELNDLLPGSAGNSIEYLFTNELDNFDEFFAELARAEKSNSDSFLSQVVLAPLTNHNEISASLSSQGYVGASKGKEPLKGLKATPCRLATTLTELIEGEPTLHILSADEPFLNSLAKEVTFSSKEFPSVQSEPQLDRFVSSQIHPKVSFPCLQSTDGDTELGCQEMGALPPAKRPLKALKRGMKTSRSGKHDGAQAKDRKKMRDCIRVLRAIVPDGGSCSIDILLDKVVEYMDSLRTMSQDLGKHTLNSALQSYDRDNGDRPCSEAASINASWVIDSGVPGSFCPIVVENLSQPGHMLIEMLCEEHGIFLEAVQTIRRLGLTILKKEMEARNNLIWARYIIQGPQDFHRVRVLWSLMRLLGSKAPS